LHKKILRACSVTGIFLLLAVRPALGFRCDGELIDKGDSREEVRKACGEPTCMRRPQKVLRQKGGIFWPLAVDEEWVYNYGPERFVEIILFYQGKVVDSDNAGYGWVGERDCRAVSAGDSVGERRENN